MKTFPGLEPIDATQLASIRGGSDKGCLKGAAIGGGTLGAVGGYSWWAQRSARWRNPPVLWGAALPGFAGALVGCAIGSGPVDK